MKIEEISSYLFLIADCPRPIWNEKVCNLIAAEGIDSILVVGDDKTPWPSDQGPLWCYSRPLLSPDNPSKGELQRITDFIRYETDHGRCVGLWVENNHALDRILAVAETSPPTLRERVPPDDACCCRPFHNGCKGTYVCHAAPIEAAKSIFHSGILATRMRQSGQSLDAIAQEMHAAGQKDPPDYFEYVCFANGNCVAPDIVTMQRHAGLGLSPEQCDKHFYPGIRFFFRFVDIRGHPRVAHDGIQAVKVKDRIDLDAYLVAFVVPTVDRKGFPLNLNIPSRFGNRVVALDHREHFGLSKWSDAALNAVEQRLSNKPDASDIV